MNATRFLSAAVMALVVTLSASAADNPLAELEARMSAAASGSLNSVEVESITFALSEALVSDHRGLEAAALRLVIAYGDQIPLGRSAVIDMVRLYRDHDDRRIRRMAVVAIDASGDAWGRDFLERSVAFEDDETVRRTLRAVVRDSRAPALDAVPQTPVSPLFSRGAAVKS